MLKATKFERSLIACLKRVYDLRGDFARQPFVRLHTFGRKNIPTFQANSKGTIRMKGYFTVTALGVNPARIGS